MTTNLTRNRAEGRNKDSPPKNCYEVWFCRLGWTKTCLPIVLLRHPASQTKIKKKKVWENNKNNFRFSAHLFSLSGSFATNDWVTYKKNREIDEKDNGKRGQTERLVRVHYRGKFLQGHFQILNTMYLI